MTPLQQFLGIAGLCLTLAGLLLGYWIAPRRSEKKARAEADAKERQVVAELTSDDARAAFRVLIGNPEQGTPNLGTRVAAVEAQMRPNGGESMHDLLNELHRIAQSNAEANARVEEKVDENTRVTGEAAILAAAADDRVRALAEQQRRQHEDNTDRIRHLEVIANEERIRRDLYLATLRELYGIDLNPDE